MPAAPLPQPDSNSSPVGETVLFAAVTLPITWLLAAWWMQSGRPPLVGLALGWLPAVVGLSFARLFRREPPRAVGFAFTGLWPWIVALLSPLVLTGVAMAAGFAARVALDAPGIIRSSPERLQQWHNLVALGGTSPMRVFLISLVWMAPWLLISLAYRYDWRGRLQRVLSDGFQWVDWLFAKLLWGLTLTGMPIAPILGEEIGFRGYVARRWAARPVAAAVISASLGTAFWLPFVWMPTISGTHAEHAVRLADLWCLGVVLVALYRWSGSVWPPAVFHFSLGFWDSVSIGEPGVPGLVEGTLAGLPTLTVLRFAADAALAVVLLARWRSAEPARQVVAVIAPRRPAARQSITRQSATQAGAPSASAHAAAITPAAERGLVRGASAGVMLLMIVWTVMIAVASRTLLDIPALLDYHPYGAPVVWGAMQADMIVHAGWIVGGLIGLYLLARADRAAPSFWIMYLTLTACAFGALYAASAPAQLDHQAKHRLSMAAVCLVVALYMMFSRGVRQTFGSNGFSLGALEGLRRRVQGLSG